MQSPLGQFHPLVSRWFEERYGRPTDIQARAWPVITNGRHALLTAPTGSGKTLTAFMWAMNQLICGVLQPGFTRVLYVSPLKALNNDIQRNLFSPLEELKTLFDASGADFPEIRVLTRSGDTPQSQRREMLRHPPEILITTPESLNLLMSSAGGRSLLGHVNTVILDEIHALVSEKRGTYLITAVDRLALMAGDFQRIALSATVKPTDIVAEFIGGYTIARGRHGPDYRARHVEVIRSESSKIYQVSIHLPDDARGGPHGSSKAVIPKKDVWDPIVTAIKARIAANSATLIFVNSRKLCEKITFLINRDEPYPIAYAHHGSLSRELRYAVEARLKKGDLKAIVATNSLELGIDIGTLNEVVMVQSPPSVASTLQRLGRAGHQVNAPSKGVLFPTHSLDFLEAAVLAAGLRNQDIELAKPVENPLDVLAQVVVSMTGTQTWDLDELYDALRTSRPYRDLPREHFDLVLNMLAGRYADARVRELKPRISIDRIDNTVAAKKGALLTLYMSGGVIPDRGYFSLRHAGNNARIGELDEEFVWESRIGQIFTLGNQSWRIERITHNDVFVRPAGSGKTAPPFWIGETQYRNFHFSENIALFLTWMNARLGKAGKENADLMHLLEKEHDMDASSAAALIDFLTRQKEKTRCDLPHRYHLLIEQVSSGPGGAPGNQIILHTLWGGRVNRPYALSLEAAWEERFEEPIETYADNNCIYILLPHEAAPDSLPTLVSRDRVDTLLRKRLEGSGFFGARFRECAGRALLISNRKWGERMPLWVSRLKSKKLFDAVASYTDFPILLETWRTCLKDMFDLDSLEQMLTELQTGQIKYSFISGNHPSPMALSGSWRQINEYMYRDDSPSVSRRSMLREDLIDGLLASPDFRAELPGRLILSFEAKRKREAPGYPPVTARELKDWVQERVMIPREEWASLISAIRRNDEASPESMMDALKEKLVVIRKEGARVELIAARENAEEILSALYPGCADVSCHFLTPDSVEAAAVEISDRMLFMEGNALAELRMRLFGEWISFYGPVEIQTIRGKTGIDDNVLAAAVTDLIESDRLLKGRFSEDAGDDEICDKENFGILLRLKRTEAIPDFEPVEISALPVFVASEQGVGGKLYEKEQLYPAIEKLACYCAPAALWEMEILPARMPSYDTSWLDSAMQESDLMWLGCGRERTCFCFEQDLDLIRRDRTSMTKGSGEAADRGQGKITIGEFNFGGPGGKYNAETIASYAGMPLQQAMPAIWHHAWQGNLTNDTWLAVRRGIEGRFDFHELNNEIGHLPERRSRQNALRRSSGLRRRIQRRRNAATGIGNWHRVWPLYTDGDKHESNGEEDLSEDIDLIEKAEIEKERVRLLLDRYGILFRELLTKEPKAFQWGRIFRSLRLMELSGEIISGYFFEGIPGLQFMSPGGFLRLRRFSARGNVFWINAQDPASLCGIQLDKLKKKLPKRRMGNHLVFADGNLAMVSMRGGRALAFYVEPTHPDLQACMGVLRHLITRPFKPLRQITVETINAGDAADSPFVDALRIAFDVMIDYKHVVIYNK